MGRKNTIADRILNDARERLRVATEYVETAETQLGIARAAQSAHRMAYDALERELAPTPRKTSKKPAASPVAPKEPQPGKELLCGVCGNAEDFQDHYQPSPNYHIFDVGKLAARLPRKSRQKSEATNSIPNIEGETVNVIGASSGGD